MMQPFLIKVKETSSRQGTAIICETKCISFSFFYCNIWHESHRYNQNLPINIVARDANQSSRDYFVRLYNKSLSPLLKRNTLCLANNSSALARGTHLRWLFIICMGRPVGPRFRQMIRKNSGPVNFVPESRLPFVQIKSVGFTGKRPRRPETDIKLMAQKKWSANFRLEYSVRKNRTTFSDVPLLPEIFYWDDPKKACSIYFPTGFSRNGKQPLHISAPVPTQAEGSAVNGLCTLRYYLAFLFYLAYFYQTITDQITF